MTNPPLDSTTIGDGASVILVSGSSPLAWGELPTLLADHRSVTTYARRGYPPNDASRPTRFRDHVGDLAALCRAAPDRPIVVGWSYGGLVSLDLAIQHPDLLERLVVLEAPLELGKVPPLSLLKMAAGLLVKRTPQAKARHFLTWATTRTDGKPPDITRIPDAELEAAAVAMLTDGKVGIGRKELDAAAIAILSTRCDWLVGESSHPMYDTYATRAAAATRETITVHKVAGAGHCMALDAPEVIVDVVLDR